MYSYQLIKLCDTMQMLIEHLDTHWGAVKADIRIGIASVLSHIIGIAAHSIGPALLEIFNSLLRHLRQSVEQQRQVPPILSGRQNSLRYTRQQDSASCYCL